MIFCILNLYPKIKLWREKVLWNFAAGCINRVEAESKEEKPNQPQSC